MRQIGCYKHGKSGNLAFLRKEGYLNNPRYQVIGFHTHHELWDRTPSK